MLLEKLHAMIYAIQHGSYKEFENAHTELTIACRDADEKLATAQQNVQLTAFDKFPHGFILGLIVAAAFALVLFGGN